MLYYNGTDLSKGIDVPKSNNSKECIVCHYCFFNHGFKFQDSVCSGCHDLTKLCLNISDIVIITDKSIDYRFIFHENSISEAIHLLQNYVLDDRSSSILKIIYITIMKNLMESKMIYLMIYFTRYHPDKSIKMLKLYYDELIEKIEEYEGKKCLMVDNYILDKVLRKIKRIDVEKLDNIKILVDTDDK